MYARTFTIATAASTMNDITLHNAVRKRVLKHIRKAALNVTKQHKAIQNYKPLAPNALEKNVEKYVHRKIVTTVLDTQAQGLVAAGQELYNTVIYRQYHRNIVMYDLDRLFTTRQCKHRGQKNCCF